jgi:arylsulfatase A-like enzyme
MGQARRYLPLQRGFVYFYGHGNNGIDYYTHERYGVPSMFRGNERTSADRGTYATDLFEREAIQFITGSGEQPWFLYLCFNAPHGASSFGDNPSDPKSRAGVQAPEKYLAKYADSPVPEKLRPYYAAVTCMDDALGRILQTIADRKQDANTLVVFQSDNGGSGNGGNAPLKGAKSTLWEGGLRVPCVARWPARIAAGRTSDEFLTTLELFPTLAAIAGAKLPEGLVLDGYDMLSVWQGESASPRKEMFWEFRGEKAARIGSLKWIDSSKAKGLYDLAVDPGEKDDLTATQPAIATNMKSRWEVWRKELEAAEPRGPFRDY